MYTSTNPMLFEYPCPDSECRTTNDLHTADCPHENYTADEMEVAYLYIFSKLSSGAQSASAIIPSTGGAEIEEIPSDDVGAAADQSFIESALYYLLNSRRITPTSKSPEEVGSIDGVNIRLLPPDEYREEVSEPQMEPIRTVYEKGSVPGCHDNAVFAMIAFYEMVGFSWEETKQHVLDWLDETGTWDRGGFAEPSPEALVDQKQHVYESGYGWKEKAQAAKNVIDRELS